MKQPAPLPIEPMKMAAAEAEPINTGNSPIVRPADGDPPWDLVIRPHHSALAIPLAEIWRYRDLLYLFVRRDIVSFYKQTILGPLWFFIQPLLTTAIFMLVFGRIAGLSTDGAPQILFYLCGITLWNYFSECFNKTSTVFKDNAQLFGKVYFPRIITPLSIVTANLLRFFIQLALFALIASYYYATGEAHIRATILLFPLVIGTMAFLGLGFGMFFSALTTKYRDLAFLLQFGVQLLMYATPVIYPFSEIPASLQPVLAWNPLAAIFETARHSLLGTGTFSPLGLLYSITFTAVVFVLSTVIFNRVERSFIDTV